MSDILWRHKTGIWQLVQEALMGSDIGSRSYRTCRLSLLCKELVE